MTLAKTWELYYVPNHCVEVRALGLRGNNRLWSDFAAGAVSGYFDDEASYTACVLGLDKLTPKGIYISCNPIKPELLARANNRLIGAREGNTTAEVDIAYRRWLRLDLDPVRASGISSTLEELQAANTVARHILATLKADGWGDGILATSGNGMDTLYAINLPNDPASKELIKNTLAYLHERFSTEQVHVDMNLIAANIMTKVYGTVARKGDSIPDRPHRRSGFVFVPEVYAPINEHLIKPSPRQPVQVGNYKDMTVAQVEEYLSFLPLTFGSTPEGYRQWYSVLMAVHSAIGEEGIALCEQYIPGKPNEIASKFHSFNGHGTSPGTLVHYAKEYGWKPPLPYEHTYTQPAAASDEASTEDINFPAVEEEADHDTGELGFDIYDYAPEDGGILDAWLSHYGEKWLFNANHNIWLYWNGTHWKPDQVAAVGKETQWLTKAINLEAADRYNNAKSRPEQNKAGAYVSATKRTSGRVQSVIHLAEQQKGITADTINLGNSLNLANGLLDLDTLRLLPHSREHIITYCLPYAYDSKADCPRWKQFVREVLVKEDGRTPDEEVILLMQELMAYSLTNATNHQVMIWLAGEGSNGKSVLVGIMQRLLGTLARSVNFHTLGTPGNYDLANMVGTRVMFSVEAERGQRIQEGLIKKLVDGESISARQIYAPSFMLTNVGKIWWAMNHMPSINDTSHSIWRRLMLIVFHRTFSESEKDIFLMQKLEAELSGILNWCIDGLIRLRSQGHFSKSVAVAQATAEYANDSNVVREWMTEQCIASDNPITTRNELYKDYQLWIVNNGHKLMSSNSFSRELTKLAKFKRSSSGYVYALLFAEAIKNL